jgi:hypothetical protein
MRDIPATGCDAAGVLDIPYGEGRAMLGGGCSGHYCLDIFNIIMMMGAGTNVRT